MIFRDFRAQAHPPQQLRTILAKIQSTFPYTSPEWRTRLGCCVRPERVLSREPLRSPPSTVPPLRPAPSPFRGFPARAFATSLFRRLSLCTTIVQHRPDLRRFSRFPHALRSDAPRSGSSLRSLDQNPCLSLIQQVRHSSPTFPPNCGDYEQHNESLGQSQF
jgi:hypothetical protein